MRIVVTGGAGFIGSRVVARLRDRGEQVVALVRDPAKAPRLAGLGAELVADDLSDVDRLRQHLTGVDAVIHAAGSYRIGLTADERPAMWDANVGTTTRILDAAEATKIPRIVYVSTVNTFGNTNGRIVDEGYRRDPGAGFLSWYDETKFRAHEVAEQRIAAGAPIVVAMPGTVVGPGDHSQAGAQLALAYEGRLPYVAVADMGVAPAHVDDVAAGITAAFARGEVGRSYIVAGDCIRFGEALAIAAEAGGRRLPRLRVPNGLLRAMTPFGRLIGERNAREVYDSSAGVTYWARSDRAKAELGYAPRDAATAIRDTLAGR
jgi:dihydroflavonol-4-reductase